MGPPNQYVVRYGHAWWTIKCQNSHKCKPSHICENVVTYVKIYDKCKKGICTNKLTTNVTIFLSQIKIPHMFFLVFYLFFLIFFLICFSLYFTFKKVLFYIGLCSWPFLHSSLIFTYVTKSFHICGTFYICGNFYIRWSNTHPWYKAPSPCDQAV